MEVVEALISAMLNSGHFSESYGMRNSRNCLLERVALEPQNWASLVKALPSDCGATVHLSPLGAEVKSQHDPLFQVPASRQY